MATPLPFRLTLASGSRGRRYLLEKAGYAFDVVPANVDEPTQARYGCVRQYVQELAWLKAAAVAPRIADGVVLAADTVGWLDDNVVGKPDDEADARRILSMLSGRVHELWTGVCLWRIADGWQLAWQERSLVRMRPLAEEEIDSYLATRRWEGCSGAYSIEEQGDPYLTIEEGTLSNVIGLPIETLAVALRAVGRL
jgi:septum formation protein